MSARHVILPITRQKQHVFYRVFKMLLAILYDTSYDLRLVFWGLIVPNLWTGHSTQFQPACLTRQNLIVQRAISGDLRGLLIIFSFPTDLWHQNDLKVPRTHSIIKAHFRQKIFFKKKTQTFDHFRPQKGQKITWNKHKNSIEYVSNQRLFMYINIKIFWKNGFEPTRLEFEKKRRIKI